MCGDPPSSPVISSDSEKSFSSAVKRCICTWGGEGEVCHSANTGCFIPGKRWWYGEGIAPMKIFWKFFKDFPTLTSSVLSIWYPIYRELDRPNSFSKLSTLNSFWFPKAIQFSLLCMKTACQGQPMGRAVFDCVRKPRLHETCEMVVRHLKTGKRHWSLLSNFLSNKKARWKIPLSFIGLFYLLHAERLVSASRELEDPWSP